MKTFKQVVNEIFSTKCVGIAVFVFTAIALTIILSSRYYMHHSIIENGASKRDVIASKTIKVVDVDKTNKLKNEIMTKVVPILVPVQDDFIKNNMDKNLEKVDVIKNSAISDDEKLQELIKYFNLTEDNTVDIPQLEYLVKISDTHYDKLELATRNSLYKILDNGVSETDIQEHFDKLLKVNSSKYLSNDDFSTIEFLIKSVIAPNIVVDEESTETARKSAVNSVKPVEITYKAGSKIVSAGQIVSKVQKEALKQCGYNVIQINISGILGIFLIILLTLVICAYYVEKYEPALKRKEYYALLSTMMIFISAFAVIFPNHIIFLPIVTFTIIVSIFMNNKVALVSSLGIISAITLALQLDGDYIAVIIFGTFATVYALTSIDYTSRMDLVKVGGVAAGVYLIGTIGTILLEYNLDELNITEYALSLVIIVGNAILSSILALGLLPVLESIFKISTPYGLMELANSNNPLLQKLQEKAPGTHHHSQMVAILAEAAAEAVGASPILARIGSLYHDVGKINRPLFFIENQSYYGIDNPHEQFSPKFSKMVITTHPKEGVEEAKKYNIPPAIYPFILEHHGDSIVSYFYNEAVKQEGIENVSEEEYRYNAPRPSSKESAIVMLADGVESAVRSLKNPSFEEIDAKVNAIINGKLLDNQLSDSDLSLKDLKVITATFNRVLKGMHHQRIKYHEDFETIQEKVSKTEDNSDEH